MTAKARDMEAPSYTEFRMWSRATRVDLRDSSRAVQINSYWTCAGFRAQYATLSLSPFSHNQEELTHEAHARVDRAGVVADEHNSRLCAGEVAQRPDHYSGIEHRAGRRRGRARAYELPDFRSGGSRAPWCRARQLRPPRDNAAATGRPPGFGLCIRDPVVDCVSLWLGHGGDGMQY